ncbi:MAG: AraC family transcriptional regulator [Rhodococcus sp. (in: high G+C Gram-positive bacteria)]|nr:MAG: AraC family transcriptional regulator [Rhodococcus sp. (in: high G+C Gram-positive bacteria)]
MACPLASVKLALAVNGTTTVTQSGKRTTLQPGEMTVYATDSPYTVGSSMPFDLSIAVLPLDCFDATSAWLRSNAGAVIDARSGRQICSDLFEHTDHEIDVEFIGDRIQSLLQNAKRPADVTSLHGLYDSALELIGRRIESRRLTPQYLADALGVSRRTLYLAFEAHHATIARTILAIRLERARGDLIAQLEAPIGDIARRYAFADLAHFSRRFRAQFGLPPSAYRDRL